MRIPANRVSMDENRLPGMELDVVAVVDTDDVERDARD